MEKEVQFNEEDYKNIFGSLKRIDDDLNVDNDSVGLFIKANKSDLEIAELAYSCYDLLSTIDTGKKSTNEKLKSYLSSIEFVKSELPFIVRNIKDNGYGAGCDEEYLSEIVGNNRVSLLNLIAFTQKATQFFVRNDDANSYGGSSDSTVAGI